MNGLKSEMNVTPFEVTGVDDYNKLVTDFGCTPMTSAVLDRFEKLTGHNVPLGYRNFVISHRDFDKFLDSIENHEPVYLYTGRGPSSDRMHLGHLVPFRFCQFLQSALSVPVVIQLTDDEKFIFKEDLTLDRIGEMVIENIKDIIACGFDPTMTFIFTNTGFIGNMYPMVLKIEKLVNLRQILNTFGFSVDGTSIGKIAFPAMQAAPAFAETFATTLFKSSNINEIRKIRCLIPCAIDQDPYFRVCRDIASRLKHHKPAVIHTKFLPSLEGTQTKMSSSKPESCIFLGDSNKQIRKKINKAFSGGQELLDDHRKYGGDPNKDVAYSLLTFFSDTNTCAHASASFKNGTMSCGEMKSLAADTVTRSVSEFCNQRAALTDRTIERFTHNRK